MLDAEYASELRVLGRYITHKARGMLASPADADRVAANIYARIVRELFWGRVSDQIVVDDSECDVPVLDEWMRHAMYLRHLMARSEPPEPAYFLIRLREALRPRAPPPPAESSRPPPQACG